jgi:hypothetical protein
MKIEFFWFSKNTRLSDLMKIRQVDAELFHANGRADRQERHNEANKSLLRTRLNMKKK